MKGVMSHEAGLRIILHAIATSAARYGLAMEPLLSLSIVRLVHRQRSSPGCGRNQREDSLAPIIVLVLIVGPKLFIEPGTKAFFQLSSVSGPGL